MFPVEVESLKVTASGAPPPEVEETENTAVGGVLVVGAVKAKGAECGLCEPSAKAAVRVKSAVLVSMETRQSMEVAAGLDVWQPVALPDRV
jgi:hypothetical protein